MSFPIEQVDLPLGAGYEGAMANLRARLVDRSGVVVVDWHATGFQDFGGGYFAYNNAAAPDGFTGSVVFALATDLTTPLASAAVTAQTAPAGGGGSATAAAIGSASAAASFEVVVYGNRVKEFSGALYQADGLTGLVLSPSDVLLFKVGAAPLLDVSSASVLAGGSRVIIDYTGMTPTTAEPYGRPAAYRVRVAGADLAAAPEGTYDGEVILVDADGAKTMARGVVHVVGAPGGSVS
jgi:hypothetical protein